MCHLLMNLLIYLLTVAMHDRVKTTEIRDHGVGFFEFSKDEETRRQQLEALKKLRQQVMNTHVAVDVNYQTCSSSKLLRFQI